MCCQRGQLTPILKVTRRLELQIFFVKAAIGKMMDASCK